MRVALVTGGHGFVGRHLRPELRSRGWTVVGLGRSAPSLMSVPDAYRRVDLSDAAAVAEALEAVRPDVIFHLAATTPPAGDDPLESLLRQTVAASYGLGVAVRRAGRPVRVVLAGSSAQYGDVPRSENPVAEAFTTPYAPVGAYGFAKAAAESVLRGLASGAFEVIPTRAFNHIGPGEPGSTVAGAFAARIREVLAGRVRRVRVADLDSVRDFTDVRDIARGYADLAERGVPDRVYNLCSGRPATVGDVLDALLTAGGLDRSVVEVVPAAAGGRGSRIAYQVGSPDRVQREIGWTAEIGLEQSAKDLLAAPTGRPAQPEGMS